MPRFDGQPLVCGQAAGILEEHPAAMQLRVLSTMTEVASDRNSTLVFPIPVELLRFFDSQRIGSPTPVPT